MQSPSQLEKYLLRVEVNCHSPVRHYCKPELTQQRWGWRVRRQTGRTLTGPNCFLVMLFIRRAVLLSWCAAKLIYWYLVGVKEITAFIAGCQARRTGSSCNKDPTSWWLSGKGIVQATLEVSQGLTWSAHGHSSLVGDEMLKWWFKNLNHHPPDSSQSGVCLLCCGHHTVNILHWVGIIASVK